MHLEDLKRSYSPPHRSDALNYLFSYNFSQTLLTLHRVKRFIKVNSENEMFVVFIPIAEQTGSIAKTDDPAIRQARVDGRRGRRASAWPSGLLGQAPRMRVVVEGIETEDQRDAIQSMGADKAQGYLFGRPESVETLLPRLRKVDQTQAQAAAAPQQMQRISARKSPHSACRKSAAKDSGPVLPSGDSHCFGTVAAFVFAMRSGDDA